MMKAYIRREFLARRRALSENEVAQRSDRLRKHLIQRFPTDDWQWLHVFLPILQQKEPDTWGIIREFLHAGSSVKLAVPVVQADGRTLRHYHLAPDTQLVDSRWGIPEPVGAAEVQPVQLDAVLVPLLAFDENGHRVGYGKGFYDEFLGQCRPDALRIGLSLEPPVSRITDSWPGDIRLHACITPEKVWRFEV
ncbi:5-formyltetrahydrofolate cyclo-ligase [Hymenobacter taeanensis]|uniref:5-formyltetrahydrofolate cyclo-ligase n=1 Tax=Hymenobacter taeanensis TaxID=2735321 RepID=A0A6M6BHG6_9BACT|nr:MULTISPECIES: 5-formyltetrahydrofolate cyclo-ligase [Hymenobacter]QJX46485.1 5-formyltetrahydrofolate cyclo-ligase [Hymenobacter taeanensis]UOQ80348.1 5-formyltetrahydrofolate cyclo-ligase [Hymenobacter sp. 5414T-23]